MLTRVGLSFKNFYRKFKIDKRNLTKLVTYFIDIKLRSKNYLSKKHKLLKEYFNKYLFTKYLI